MAKKKSSGKRVALIASSATNPAVKVKAGMKLRVSSVSVVDPAGRRLRPVGSRLCGGTTTCLALVDLEA
jgi:hypothetical protein